MEMKGKRAASRKRAGWIIFLHQQSRSVLPMRRDQEIIIEVNNSRRTSDGPRHAQEIQTMPVKWILARKECLTGQRQQGAYDTIAVKVTGKAG
jgi:hypothetical protein